MGYEELLAFSTIYNFFLYKKIDFCLSFIRLLLYMCKLRVI